MTQPHVCGHWRDIGPKRTRFRRGGRPAEEAMPGAGLSKTVTGLKDGVTVITPAGKKAFQIFDVDKSGSISAEELVKILTRDTPAGKPLSLDDAKEIISDFDRRGTGELNVSCSRFECAIAYFQVCAHRWRSAHQTPWYLGPVAIHSSRTSARAGPSLAVAHR